MIGNRIKELRIKKNLTLKEFAKKIGTGHGYISKLERHISKNPSKRFIISICQAFNVNIKWLETGEGPMLQSDLSQIGKETRPAVYPSSKREENYRQICNDSEPLSLEDQESILTLLTIFTSDDEETKIAIRQNIKQFHKLACGEKPIRGKPSEEKRISTGSPRRGKKAV